jgi:hypothetical protein
MVESEKETEDLIASMSSPTKLPKTDVPDHIARADSDDTGQRILSKNKVTGGKTYHLNLFVKTEKLGPETKMCVCGSLPQLGEWKEFIHRMEWTEGGIFIT